MTKQTNTVLPEFNRLCAGRKKRRGGKGRGRKKPFPPLLNHPSVFLLFISPSKPWEAGTVTRDQALFYLFIFFASFLLWLEREKKKQITKIKGDGMIAG